MPSGIYAQDYRAAAVIPVNGYVILSNGDTLNGKIKWRLKYVEINPTEIKFTADNGNTRIFSADEINGFGNYLRITKEYFDTQEELEMENYISMPSFKKGVPVFYNLLLDGRIRVFQNRSSLQLVGEKVEEISEYDGIVFSFSRDEGLRIGPTYKISYRIIEGRIRHSSYFLSKDEGSLLKVTRDNYNGYFKSLFEDCPDIQQELVNNPDLRKFKNFILLTEVYNQLCT